MTQITVTINGRAFPITCDDGQEPRIRRLAQYVDAKVGDFVRNVGQVGEARLILLAALVIADELSDANEALAQEKGRSRFAESAADTAAAGIGRAAQRIETVAARLESP
jgi:cell division protein ZapA